ncbi:MAG: uL15 family ribosomal protein [Candidatus Sungbacteria bacterium]|nr:uL15 family ribosomal protein [Candidatus Sungbacteria bacterium]
MQLHNVQTKTKFRRGQRIGRGGKRGTTAGRGTKGQKSRAGHRIRPALRDIIKKIPKSRGFKFRSFRKKSLVLNLSVLNDAYKEGEIVSPHTLVEKGLADRMKGRLPKIKILGDGALKKKLTFKDVEFSRTARTKTGA